jgi:hypothetical protein
VQEESRVGRRRRWREGRVVSRFGRGVRWGALGKVQRAERYEFPQKELERSRLCADSARRHAREDGRRKIGEGVEEGRDKTIKMAGDKGNSRMNKRHTPHKTRVCDGPELAAPVALAEALSASAVAGGGGGRRAAGCIRVVMAVAGLWEWRCQWTAKGRRRRR